MTTGEHNPRRVRANTQAIRGIRLKHAELRTYGLEWTQAAVAKRAQISKRALQYIEAGQRGARPYEGTLERIALALMVPDSDITQGDEEDEPVAA